MRILHTIGRISETPADSDVLEIARSQADRGCHVVLSAARQAPIAEAAHAAGLNLAPADLGTGFAGRAAIALRAAVRHHAIEVIHVHDDAASVLALMCADLCPIVRTLDAMPETAVAFDAVAFDHVIVATTALRNRLVKAELAAPEHVTVTGGSPAARQERILEAYERAIVRSITGRLIPPRFIAGRPDLQRLAARAAE